MSLRGVVFVVSVLTLPSCSKDKVVQQREVIQPAKVMIVKGSSNAINRQIPGTERASQRVQLAFHVSGQLKYFPIKEGQNIKRSGIGPT